jgi:hypothetical protein
MKRFIVLALLVVATTSNAGDYYYANRVDTYDPVTGLYYKAVLSKGDRGFISKGGPDVVNIAITNPATGAVALLFKEPLLGNITSVIFEVGFKEGSIEFYGADRPYIQNNTGLANRALKSKLLVAVREGEKKETSLFVAAKDGGNLKRVAVVPEKDDWHIDVKNSKLRVVHQLGNSIRLESYDW